MYGSDGARIFFWGGKTEVTRAKRSGVRGGAPEIFEFLQFQDLKLPISSTFQGLCGIIWGAILGKIYILGGQCRPLAPSPGAVIDSRK